MSEKKDKDEKTEDPTEKKLEEAAKKGSIPQSREIGNAATLLAILLVIWLFLPGLAVKFGEIFVTTFANLSEWPLNTNTDTENLLGRVFWESIMALLPVFLCLMVFGVAAMVLQNRPEFVLTRIAPKLSNISMIGGAKRLFGKTTLRDFFKSLVKIAGVGGLAGMVIYAAGDDISALIAVSPFHAVGFLHTIVIKLVAIIFLATAMLSIGDLIWTRKDWFEDQMMTKQEVRDEHKQSEGDPMLKMRTRSMARDRARNSMISSVKDATLVIANPTHFAVAVRYQPEKDQAPLILAKGQERIALRIREMAESTNIPVFEDPPLARSLFASAKVGQELPVEFYVPVAALIKIIMEADNRIQPR